MANNNGLYNAAIAGTLAAFTSRWITNVNPTFYQTQVLVAVAFATQVDSLIAPGSYDEGSSRVMESICNAFWTDRNPTSTNALEYMQGASALVAVFNQVQASLASEPALPASSVSYTPSTPANWPIVPTTAQAALDTTASRDEIQELDIAALQAALPQNASNTPYTVSTVGDWATAPTEVADALNQLANTRAEVHSAGTLGAAASIQFTSPPYSRQKSGLILAWGQVGASVNSSATITFSLSFADNAAPTTLSTVQYTMPTGGHWCLNTFAIVQASAATGLQWVLDASTSMGTITSASGRTRVAFIEF